MNADKINDREYECWTHAEMLESFDEELEIEIDDNRMNALVAEEVKAHDATNDLDCSAYFKELFRLLGDPGQVAGLSGA